MTKIRFDGPSDFLDVGGDQEPIPRGGTGDVSAKLAKQLDEADWADITIADASGKFAALPAPEAAAAAPPAEESAAETAADYPILGQPAEATNDKKKE